MEELWDNFNPGYYNNTGVFIEYEKQWFCNDNKIIHHNKKEFINCEHCKKII